MVQGLGFLSKKSWHTKNLANQEKVWMAEQRNEAEAQKTKELAKQIQQEREQEELDKIAGSKGSRLDRGIDWMYQGGRGELAKEDAERKAEEFLLGKEYVAEGATVGDFDNGDQDQGINNVLNKKPTVEPETSATVGGNDFFRNEPSVKDRNEDFRLRVEDPMFMVSQKQREKEQRHDKTKALYERVVGYREDGTENHNYDEDSKNHRRKKKSKKEKKPHKKHKSSSKKRDQYSDSGSDDEVSRSDSSDRSDRSGRRDKDAMSRRRRSRHRSRSRSDSPDKDRQQHYKSKRQKRSPGYKDDDDDSDSRYDRKDRYHHRSSTEEDGKRRGVSASKRHHDKHDDMNRRSKHHDREEDRRRENSGRDERKRRSNDLYNHDREDRHNHSKSSRKHDDDGRNRRRSDEQHSSGTGEMQRKECFGLKGGDRKVPLDTNDLGPNRELLQQKREKQEAERRRIRELASTRRQRTEEERQRALEEMQANARKREQARSHQGDSTGASRRGKGDGDYDEDVPRHRDASFLKDITRQSHGIGEGSQSLSSRVAQNRHTNQRLHDSFL